jgi:hypothetical protein
MVGQSKYLGEQMAIEKVGFDRDACSYVIRMWREKAASEQENGEWRGWIEHVQSGRRVFFRDMTVISTFISENLLITSES